MPMNFAMVPSSYDKLLEHLRRHYLISSIGSLLGWDEQVNLPPASADQRAEQNALLADWRHREFTRPEVGDWLAELEGDWENLDADRQTVVKWTRRDYDRARQLPASFVKARAAHRTASFQAWVAARQSDDFPSFAPFLHKMVEFAREEADLNGWSGRSLDYHIDRHDPGMTTARIDVLFGQLRGPLHELLDSILASPRKADLSVFRGFDTGRQRDFILQVLAKIGFDFNRGRLDVAPHPFCSGDAADTRMTTRFDPDNPLDALFSSIHETGHAIYGQQLSMANRFNPLGQPVGMAVHESQSRLWENQIGRSRAFWSHFEPVFRRAFPAQLKGVSRDDLYLAINAVARNPIRVDSDEVSYNLHIILRYELEKGLLDGSLRVGDLPAAWREKSLKILGLAPSGDAEGVLQDVHWSGGMFGYFPSYCLGNMMAAQLWQAMRHDLPDLDSHVAAGDFRSIRLWLKEKIHCHGRRHDTDELVKRATGQPLNPGALLLYLRDRYLTLYANGTRG